MTDTDPASDAAGASESAGASEAAGASRAGDLALATAIVESALAGTGAQAEIVLGVPAVRIGDRVVARVLDGALLLAPSDAVIPPPPEGVAVESVRPWTGARPHLRVMTGALAPPAPEAPAAAWIRAAVLATAERVPDVRLPEPTARIPHPRRPRT